jgi:hypothetical protein
MGFICGVAAGYAVWLLVIRRFEDQPMQRFTPRPAPPAPAPVAESEPVAEPEPVAEHEPEPEPVPEPVAEVVPLPVMREPEPVEPEPPVRDSERRLQELTALRSELLRKVDRRALYTMAHDRGLPHHTLFAMSPEQLYDAVLAAEHLPPSDVLPSAETEQHVRQLAAEAFARHERFAAEDAASELDAG